MCKSDVGYYWMIFRRTITDLQSAHVLRISAEKKIMQRNNANVC